MLYNTDQHHRRSLRLPGYDYAQVGAYFITVCAQDRACIFGEVVDGEMRLNQAGRMVHDEWLRTEAIRSEVRLDVFQVMPNHFHAIVMITGQAPSTGVTPDGVGAHGRAPLRRAPKSLGSLVAGFKSAVTKNVNQMRGTPGQRLWQRNYYEHVIRHDRELDATRQYIVDNPAKWAEDRDNPQNPQM